MNRLARWVFVVVTATAPLLASPQNCKSWGTSTTLKHPDGSWTRVETDIYCNTHVEKANPTTGNLEWRSQSNYKDRDHYDVVKEHSPPGTVATGSSKAQPGPVIQGPQTPPAPAPAPAPAPQPPAAVPKAPNAGGGGREGGVGNSSGGIDFGRGGGPGIGRPGDYGNQPGAPGVGGGGGGGRKCMPGDSLASCLTRIVRVVSQPTVALAEDQPGAPGAASEVGAFSPWPKFGLIMGGLVAGLMGLFLINRESTRLNPSDHSRALTKRGLWLATFSAAALLIAGIFF